MDCFFVILKCRVREFFRTFRFSRFLHVSFFKSSTFRFAGFILYKNIISKEFLTRKDYQQIAQYSVQIHSKFEKENADRIAETSNGVKVWSGAYSEDFGLSNEYEIYCI